MQNLLRSLPFIALCFAFSIALMCCSEPPPPPDPNVEHLKKQLVSADAYLEKLEAELKRPSADPGLRMERAEELRLAKSRRLRILEMLKARGAGPEEKAAAGGH